MQPTTAPVANNTRTSIVAHSPAGRQLLEALAAIEAEFQANAGAALPEGATVLPALATQGRNKVRHHVFDGNRLLEITDRAGNEDSYVCRRACPGGWRPSYHNPAHWTQHFERIDAQGRLWTACGGTFVMDDFGMLVEVQQ